jgi:hypothetical protein
MKKAQFEAIVSRISKDQGDNVRLRLNLQGGSWFQGTCQMIGDNTLIVTQENKQIAYVDLGVVISITAG